MTQALAILLSTIVAAIAALHAYWGAGCYWPAASALELSRTVVGAAGIRQMPSPSACFIVAAALLAISIWPLVAGGLIRLPVAPTIVRLAGVALAVVFLARGIAAYTAAWRRIWPEQPFARLDRQIYGPLCLALGTGFAALLFAGPSQ